MTFLAYAMAFIFSVWSNAHFGWNTFPGSDAELIADGIAIVMCFLAMIVHSIERKRDAQ